MHHTCLKSRRFAVGGLLFSVAGLRCPVESPDAGKATFPFVAAGGFFHDPGMTFLVVKYAVTAFVVVAVSEIARRSDRLGALLASLPLVTVLVMIWLHYEKQETTKIANHAYYTFWYVLPTMPMFLLMPWMLNRGYGFWASLGAGCLTVIVLFLLAAWILKRFDISLLP